MIYPVLNYTFSTSCRDKNDSKNKAELIHHNNLQEDPSMTGYNPPAPRSGYVYYGVKVDKSIY